MYRSHRGTDRLLGSGRPIKGRIVDLQDAVAYHQLLLAAEGRSERTQKQYLFYERKFLEHLDRQHIEPTLDALDLPNVRRCLVWYRSLVDRRRVRGAEVATRAMSDTLKRLDRVLASEDIIPEPRLTRLGRPTVTRITRQPFSRHELTALWAASQQTQQPVRDEALFLLLLDTGMRIGEAAGLQLARVNLAEATVTVLGKGKHERTIPIGNPERRGGGRTLKALRRYIHERLAQWDTNHDLVFCARDGFPLTARGGSEVLHRLGDTAGVAECFPHRLRHTFATNFLTMFPGDEQGLRRILGHLSEPVLSNYVHLSSETVAQRAGRASIVESLLG